MDTAAILETISKVIKQIVDLTPTVIKTVEDATPFAEAIYNALKGKNVTLAQLEELEAKITKLSNRLQEPLPEDDGNNVNV